MKRIILVLFFVVVGALLYTDGLWMKESLDADAQGRRPAPIDYSKFKHSSHAGAMKASRSGGVQRIDCAYCHGTLTNDNPEVLRGYPYGKFGMKSKLTHSACLDCHAFTGRDAIVTGTLPEMCLICHQDATKFAEMDKNLRPFPNPAVAESQFFDRYSHKRHALYFNASETVKERFKDKGKFKEKDNFECAACHTTDRANIVAPRVQFALGVMEGLPGHRECFVCHLNEKEVTKEQPTLFATNCVGCHSAKREQTGKGSEPSVHWFVRQIVNSEGYPPNQPKPCDAPAAGPFSHKTHEYEEDYSTKKCLECHATGKRAEKRSDFFLADRETKENQPRAAGCVQCHKKCMEQKIEGAVKLEASGCNYCHSLQTIKERAARGVQLPPPNHFSKRPAPAPPPKPDSK